MFNTLILIVSFFISFFLITLIREHGIITVLRHPLYVIRLALPFSAIPVAMCMAHEDLPSDDHGLNRHSDSACEDDLPYMPNEGDNTTVCLWCTAPTVRGTKVCATHYGS